MYLHQCDLHENVNQGYMYSVEFLKSFFDVLTKSEAQL